MATRSDMLLMRALSQFGAGLGSHMSRRRQGKQDEEFFKDMYPGGTTPEEMMDPQDTQLIQALTGNTMPGIAGMVSGAGMQGNQMMRASGQAEQANAHDQRMRGLAKDPRIAGMMKQGMAQAELAKSMPQEARAPISLGGGKIAKWNGSEYEIEQIGDVVQEFKPGNTYSVNGKKFTVPAAPKSGGTWVESEIATGEKDSKGRMLWQTYLRDNKAGTLGEPQGVPHIKGESNMTQFDGSNSPPTKTTLGKLQTDIMGVDKTRAAYQRTLDSYDPKFLDVPDKIWRWGQEKLDKSGAERILGVDILSEESWAEYEKAVTFKQNTMKSVNAHIKALTGAQMSHYEIPRLMSEMPNMMDSKRAFKVKIENVIEVADEAHAMMSNYIENGTVAPGFHDVYLETKKKWEGQADPAQIEKIAILEAAQAFAASAIANEIQFGGGGGQPASNAGELAPGLKVRGQ